MQLWPFHARNTVEKLLGANSVWLIVFGSTKKDHKILDGKFSVLCVCNLLPLLLLGAIIHAGLTGTHYLYDATSAFERPRPKNEMAHALFGFHALFQFKYTVAGFCSKQRT